ERNRADIAEVVHHHLQHLAFQRFRRRGVQVGEGEHGGLRWRVKDGQCTGQRCPSQTAVGWKAAKPFPRAYPTPLVITKGTLSSLNAFPGIPQPTKPFRRAFQESLWRRHPVFWTEAPPPGHRPVAAPG